MTGASSVGELYMDKDAPPALADPQHLGDVGQAQPPIRPTDVPPPTQRVEVAKPVVSKRLMADENPDGSIRDTSSEALEPKNDLGFRNIDNEAEAAKQAEKQKPAEPVVEAKLEQAPEPPKVYAKKFNKVEDLEKSYEEVQAAFTRVSQEKAALERQALAQQKPVEPPPRTPEQIQTEKDEAARLVNDFVMNPKEFLSKFYNDATQKTQVALAAQQVTNDWRKNNADIADNEFYVASEMYRLAQSDPELAKNPATLINKATENFRQVVGKLRTEGAKEALTQETRVVPLTQGSAPPTATEQPAKAPLTTDDAYSLHMRFLKEQEQRSHRGLRR